MDLFNQVTKTMNGMNELEEKLQQYSKTKVHANKVLKLYTQAMDIIRKMEALGEELSNQQIKL